MFLSCRSWYARTEQRASGPFLILFAHDGHRRTSPAAKHPVPELRALVRYARMSQLGNFMMASVTVSVGTTKHEIVLSGTYGADGLPKEMTEVDVHAPLVSGQGLPTKERWPGLWERLHPVPEDLQDAFWAGGGHNTSGTEGPALRSWARNNRVRLSRLRRAEVRACASSVRSG